MNKQLFLIFGLLASINLAAQTVSDRAYSAKLQTLLSHSVPEISVSEVDTAGNIVFVDSREKSEYETSHIKNALWVGYKKLDLSPLENVAKEKQIIVYCSVGYRSEKVAEKLIKQGFTNVYNLYGGIFEWKNNGRNVYKEGSIITNDVHAYDKNWGKWLTNGKKCYK